MPDGQPNAIVTRISDVPELRTDPITGQQVIIAPDRGNRPGAFAQTTFDDVTDASKCPFCPGGEDRTPPAVLTQPISSDCDSDQASATRKPLPQSWSMRVVPNLYPATSILRNDEILRERENTCKSTSRAIATRLYQTRINVGCHEVVIETARHVSRFTDLTTAEAEQVFLAYAQRFRNWQSETDIRFGIAFKNNGRAAGASLDHAHSQLVGLNSLPKGFSDEWKGAEAYFEKHQMCVFCDLMETELAEQTSNTESCRIVDCNDDFVVLCPFASRAPYEMWILPRRHASHYDRQTDDLVRATGRKTLEILTRLTQQIENVPYNYLIHTAPFDTLATHHYHWHVEIIPRITRLAGFEWGTGLHINPVPPEQAAALLRSI